MVGDAGELLWATSEHLGVGRLTAEFVSTDPISKDEHRRLRAHLVEVLEPVAAQVARYEPKRFVGSSGTLEDLAHMVAARRKENVPDSLNQLEFTRDEFLSLHKLLLASSADERLRLDGLEARRVDLITAGSLFLATAMDLFGIEDMVISEWALREGIVLDAIARRDPAEWSDDPRAIRRASVEALARRCNVADDHARHVATLACELFDGTQELHGLGSDDRELLEYGALLHDIGEHVASQGHHKHGAYLIRHGQLRGFTPEEVQLLAGLARWHRRGQPKATGGAPAPRRVPPARAHGAAPDRRRARPEPERDRRARRRPRRPVARGHPDHGRRRLRARALGRAQKARAVREGLRARSRAGREPGPGGSRLPRLTVSVCPVTVCPVTA